MEIGIETQGAFGAARVRLEPGESFVSESGAFYRSTPNVEIDVTTRSRGRGGLLGGLKRLLAAESFFLSTYRPTGDEVGEVGLAPVLPGEVRHLTVDSAIAWVCAGGSFLGASSHVSLDVQFQGMRGLLGGESLFFMRASGEGDLLVSGYGRLTELEVQGGMVVDTGHVVAFEETLEYTLSKAGGSWLQSFLGGEGLVFRFEGHGRIVVQSHDPGRFGRAFGRLLPPRSR